MPLQQTGNMVSNEFLLGMMSEKTAPRIELIEEFTDRYPWCAIGHKSLFNLLCAQGKEAWLSYASKASAYIYNRGELYALVHTPRPGKRKVSEEKAVKNVETPLDPIERIVMVGGDYFAMSDFNTTILEEKNPIDKFIKNNPKLTPVQLFQEDQEEKVSLQNVGDDNFMTETLAKIYADQSLYQLAIEAYQKLILLYPKKSDYFASLIKEIKIKMNR